MNAYAIYLRKSRADVEAEARGEGARPLPVTDRLYAPLQRVVG